MQTFAALVYWVIVALWLGVLVVVTTAYWRNRQTFGTVRLLLSVVAIDTTRNIIGTFISGSILEPNMDCSREQLSGSLDNRTF
jgi:phosphoglycerol transferase MdoB-like AlkP superfamily enzyme